MRRTASILLAVACSCALLISAAPAAWASKRVAFVVGIDRYDNLKPEQQLRKAVNDARTVSETLASLGFAVRKTENASRIDLLRQWQQFLNGVEPGDIATFFFAGHGVEIGGLNYLLARDVPQVAAGEEEVLKAAALPLNGFLEQLRGKHAQVSLYIIDACRDNPFVDSRGRGLGGTRGLARVEPSTGTFVMFSAGAGQTALDRLSDNDPDPNSVYTRSLVKHLRSAGLSLPDIARSVRREVLELARSVSHVQVPAYYDEVIGRFCPAGCDASPPPPINSSKPAQPDPAPQAWAATKDTTSIAVLQAFIERFAGTVYADLAQARLEELKSAAPKPSQQEPKTAVGTFPSSPAVRMPPLTRNLTVKMQTAFPALAPLLNEPAKDFAEEVRSLSSGKITVNVLKVNALVRAFQVYDGAADGVLDAGYSAPIYAYGKNTALAVFDGVVPFGLPPGKLVRWFQEEGQKLADEIYAKIGLKMLPCGVFGAQAAGWHTRPLTGSKSYRGMKIRAVGFTADFFNAAGAVVVQLPGGEIAPALERGVIDAAEFAWPLSDYRFGFQDIKGAKYYYFPGWHQPAEITDVVFGLSYWNKLSAGERQIFELACRNSLERSLARIPQREREGLDLLRKAGVQVRELPSSLLAHVRQASEPIFAEHMKRNPDFKRVYESYRRFR